MSDTILVIVEQREGKLNRVSWETLAAGQAIGSETGQLSPVSLRQRLYSTLVATSPRRARGTAHMFNGTSGPSGEKTSKKSGYSAKALGHSFLFLNL